MIDVTNTKELIERYPYLKPRNVWTDKEVENADWCLGLTSLPDGWHKLFLLMCEDIRQPLIDAGYLDKFRFSQIKEKYGEMRCYTFGAPQEVNDIIQKYEYLSQFVCCECGKPATKQSKGYILPYCNDCFTKKCAERDVRAEDIYAEDIYVDTEMRLTIYDGKTKESSTKVIDCYKEWEKIVSED